MQMTIDTYHDRVAEIKLYHDALFALYEDKRAEDRTAKYFEDDFLKILKSNALLMIYNLVESTIVGGIVEIYDSFKEHNITYKMVRSEIQNIWFSFKFNQVYDKSAHYHSYREKASEIISFVLEDSVLELGRKATNISGNLDADKIREICDTHGIRFTTTQECRGGYVLTDVKEKRNFLAHGMISFVDCGRNYSIADLERISTETKVYLKSILDGMEDYYDQQLYRNCLYALT